MGILNFETQKFNESAEGIRGPEEFKIPENTDVSDFEHIDANCEKRPGNFWSMGLLATMVLVGIGAGVYHFWPDKNSVQAVTVNMSLTGILYSDYNPAAVVDQQIVHEGEMIKGVKVVRIYPDKVEFEKNGQKWFQAAEGTKTASGRHSE